MGKVVIDMTMSLDASRRGPTTVRRASHRVELEQLGVSHHRGVAHIEYRVVR